MNSIAQSVFCINPENQKTQSYLHSCLKHQKFLSALGFKPEEIQKIRTAKHSSEIKV
jgi:hypothetical protein